MFLSTFPEHLNLLRLERMAANHIPTYPFLIYKKIEEKTATRVHPIRIDYTTSNLRWHRLAKLESRNITRLHISSSFSSPVFHLRFKITLTATPPSPPMDGFLLTAPNGAPAGLGWQWKPIKGTFGPLARCVAPVFKELDYQGGGKPRRAGPYGFPPFGPLWGWGWAPRSSGTFLLIILHLEFLIVEIKYFHMFFNKSQKY